MDSGAKQRCDGRTCFVRHAGGRRSVTPPSHRGVTDPPTPNTSAALGHMLPRDRQMTKPFIRLSHIIFLCFRLPPTNPIGSRCPQIKQRHDPSHPPFSQKGERHARSRHTSAARAARPPGVPPDTGCPTGQTKRTSTPAGPRRLLPTKGDHQSRIPALPRMIFAG